MTKMVAMPIYCKPFSGTMTLGLGMYHLGCGSYKAGSNDDCRFPNTLMGIIVKKNDFKLLLKPKSL